MSLFLPRSCPFSRLYFFGVSCAFLPGVPWYMWQARLTMFLCRVNMYASTWICTKVAPAPSPREGGRARKGIRALEPLSIGAAIMEEAE